jgi:hypothetical protein
MGDTGIRLGRQFPALHENPMRIAERREIKPGLLPLWTYSRGFEWANDTYRVNANYSLSMISRVYRVW